MKRFYVDIMSSSDEVTGSCTLCVVHLPKEEKNIKFVVDCGCYQEKNYEQLNTKFVFDPSGLDFALITHTHVDHIGRFPFLCKKGFNNPIYLTRPASKLLPIALDDVCRVEKNKAEQCARKTLFDESDVSKVNQLLKPCDYGEQVIINEYIKVTFLINGHLVGASCIFIQINDKEGSEINLLFTGDYNNKNFFFGVKKIPLWIRKNPVTIIQESTYGNMNSTQIAKSFEHNLLGAVKSGNTVIILVFSLGRAQEILYLLKVLQQKKKLDISVPIYFDGKLAIKYTDLYLKGELELSCNMLDFLPIGVENVSKDLRTLLVQEKNDCKIIVTTAGMGSYGPAQCYLPAYISQKDTLIHFTGYCAEETLGRRLKDTIIGESVIIGGLSRKKEARVEYTTEFSAHAKADEMINFLKGFKKINFLLVNHGEKETKKTFADRVEKEVKPKDVGILSRDYLFRVAENGYVKSIPTKFI